MCVEFQSIRGKQNEILDVKWKKWNLVGGL